MKISLISYKWYFFIFSGLVIIPGLIGLLVWGLKPSIDFTGGTLVEVISKNKKPDKEALIKQFDSYGMAFVSVSDSSDRSVILRMKHSDESVKKTISQAVASASSEFKIDRIETVGPVIGGETTRNGVKAVGIASLAIIAYIAYSFRKIPKPYSSLSFGVAAVIALIHDVLVTIGIFSLLGHFMGVEVDSLFITAVLTIMGFSVHDTIVVFDRIRENLIKHPELSFGDVINESIVQTLARSLSTSLTVLFTLLALLLFGGLTLRWFVVALLVGIISGTYSSIFTAAPMLLVWEQWKEKRK